MSDFWFYLIWFKWRFAMARASEMFVIRRKSLEFHWLMVKLYVCIRYTTKYTNTLVASHMWDPTVGHSATGDDTISATLVCLWYTCVSWPAPLYGHYRHRRHLLQKSLISVILAGDCYTKAEIEVKISSYLHTYVPTDYSFEIRLSLSASKEIKKLKMVKENMVRELICPRGKSFKNMWRLLTRIGRAW